MGHQVTAPYVTLRVPNELGQEVTLGFYSGAVLPDGANQEDLDRLVRKGMIAEVKAAEPEPVPEPEPEPDSAPADGGPPPQNAPKPDWVAYAVSQRDGDVSEEDARADADAMTKADLITLYGS